MKIHHVAVSVSDINLAKEWYLKIFDLDIVTQYAKNDRAFCLLGSGDFKIELIQPLSNGEPTPDYRKTLQSDLKVGGIKHFCYQVKNLSDEIARLVRLGVVIEKEISEAGFGGYYSFIKDLDGNLIEVWSEALN